jgi:hypothetical protein
MPLVDNNVNAGNASTACIRHDQPLRLGHCTGAICGRQAFQVLRILRQCGRYGESTLTTARSTRREPSSIGRQCQTLAVLQYTGRHYPLAHRNGSRYHLQPVLCTIAGCILALLGSRQGYQNFEQPVLAEFQNMCRAERLHAFDNPISFHEAQC